MPRRYLSTSKGAGTAHSAQRMALALEEELDRPSKTEGAVCVRGEGGRERLREMSWFGMEEV